MARTGRPPNPVKRLEIKLPLHPDLLAPLDLLALDPLTGKPKYGSRTFHIERALAEYFQKYYPAMAAGLDNLGTTGHD